MQRTGTKWSVGVTAVATLLAAIASATGVFLRGDLVTMPFVTVRGEHVSVLVHGVYRFNERSIAAEGIGWDLLTLCVVVPVLLATLHGLARGRLRAMLLATGLLSYLVYQYLEYAMFLAYGPLFPVYVATFALSLSAIVLLVDRIDVGALPQRFGPRFPRRTVMALGALMAVLLCGMWFPVLARTLGGNVSGRLLGATTLVVQGLDLGLLVPLGVFTAVALHQKRPVGFLLAPVVVVKVFAMAAAICAMVLVEYTVTHAIAPLGVVVFAMVALFAAGLGVRVYASIRGAEAP